MTDQLNQDTRALWVRRIIPQTPDTKTFVLEPVDGRPIQYTPGQFLTFLFTRENGNEARRNYSISSTPFSEDSLTITVKRIPNGEYSRWFIDLVKEGDKLLTIGASGFFTLPDDRNAFDQLVFFAAGSGITPVYSLIKSVLFNDNDTHIVLIYSNTSVENTIFYQQLKALQKQFHERFHIEFLFSNATSVLHKRLGIYLLEKLINHYLTTPLSTQFFYLCGPFEYMRMITIVLKNNGVASSHIRKEIFTIEEPIYQPQPPDKESHTVTVLIRQTEFSFQTQYPHTILHTAKALKINLPYSCESGQCGTCAATCISGKVWMSRNDVLMDDELAKGRVLTCTGYAVSGDIRLAY